MWSQRLINMSKWVLLFIESILFVTIPSDVALPYSTRFLMDISQVNLEKLGLLERQEISNHVIIAGFVSMGVAFGLGLGLFGEFSPHDVHGREGDNLMNVIINQRKKNKCCICLEGFNLDDTVRVLKCKHCYHKKCLDKWLKDHKTCPICRASTLG